MRLLLDTHALIWWWTDARQLSAIARKLITDERNDILASAASAWEIATKQRLGKLGLPQLTMRRYETLLVADGFLSLAITTAHLVAHTLHPDVRARTGTPVGASVLATGSLTRHRVGP